MFKILEIIVEAVHWLMLFFCPVLAGLLLAALLYLKFDLDKRLAILIVILSAGGGLALAEYVRKKYGCSDFFARLYSTPDITNEEEEE